MLVGTFSIVARDSHSGHLGVGTASCALAVGAKVITVIPGVAAVASQSFSSQVVGRRTAQLCSQGRTPQEALAMALREDVPDPGRGFSRGAEHRQLAVIDAVGRTAMHTGTVTLEMAKPYAGHRSGTDYAVAGNLLTGEDVLTAMIEAFEQSDVGAHLSERLLAALNAAQAAGGDSRGKQAAGLATAPPPGTHPETVFDVDLRVDDHPDPLGELQRLLALVLG